ncbi:MAG: NADH:flavin oxidoreductase/NADH oxidase, partial [Acidobacteria bacterium]|nr:NADH:flavin oxidoreductase/NADH oxidase [Acidobacteriota bacterium]
MSALFTPLRLRSVELRNRIAVSPMCQYAAHEGRAGDWHLVHLGSRALGGAGLVIVEATSVRPEGRITPADLGLWSDEQIEPFRRITAFLTEHGAVPGIQLAHAGRKASTDLPWRGGRPLATAPGGWQTVAPSPLPFDDGWPEPRQLTAEECAGLPASFAAAAVRARDAGFRLVELHFAHGYLVHQFLSPLSNRRDDGWGGDLAGRTRLAGAIVEAVRTAWGDELPLLVRISATDWAEGGWDLASSIALARDLAGRGVDLVDCSSGGLVPRARVPVAPGYQVPFAEAIRREAGVAT